MWDLSRNGDPKIYGAGGDAASPHPRDGGIFPTARQIHFPGSEKPSLTVQGEFNQGRTRLCAPSPLLTLPGQDLRFNYFANCAVISGGSRLWFVVFFFFFCAWLSEDPSLGREEGWRDGGMLLSLHQLQLSTGFSREQEKENLKNKDTEFWGSSSAPGSCSLPPS